MIAVRRPGVLLMLIGSLAFPASALLAQNDPSLIQRGVYTSAQADRGKATYASQCVDCHGPDLEGTSFGDGVPPLKREGFMAGKSLNEVLDKVKRAMPFNAPGTLADKAYFDVIAFVLRENGYPAGMQELGADAELLKRAVLPQQ